jgi:hypothetical protein
VVRGSVDLHVLAPNGQSKPPVRYNGGDGVGLSPPWPVKDNTCGVRLTLAPGTEETELLLFDLP